MENNETLNESFEKEFANIQNNAIFKPEYRKRKLLFWAFRTIVLIILYVIFWEYNWVRKSLYFTIPLSTLSLLMIVVSPYLIKKKIERTKLKIEEADQLLKTLKDKNEKIE